MKLEVHPLLLLGLHVSHLQKTNVQDENNFRLQNCAPKQLVRVAKIMLVVLELNFYFFLQHVMKIFAWLLLCCGATMKSKGEGNSVLGRDVFTATRSSAFFVFGIVC